MTKNSDKKITFKQPEVLFKHFKRLGVELDLEFLQSLNVSRVCCKIITAYIDQYYIAHLSASEIKQLLQKITNEFLLNFNYSHIIINSCPSSNLEEYILSLESKIISKPTPIDNSVDDVTKPIFNNQKWEVWEIWIKNALPDRQPFLLEKCILLTIDLHQQQNRAIDDWFKELRQIKAWLHPQNYSRLINHSKISFLINIKNLSLVFHHLIEKKERLNFLNNRLDLVNLIIEDYHQLIYILDSLTYTHQMDFIKKYLPLDILSKIFNTPEKLQELCIALNIPILPFVQHYKIIVWHFKFEIKEMWKIWETKIKNLPNDQLPQALEQCIALTICLHEQQNRDIEYLFKDLQEIKHWLHPYSHEFFLNDKKISALISIETLQSTFCYLIDKDKRLFFLESRLDLDLINLIIQSYCSLKDTLLALPDRHRILFLKRHVNIETLSEKFNTPEKLQELYKIIDTQLPSFFKCYPTLASDNQCNSKPTQTRTLLLESSVFTSDRETILHHLERITGTGWAYNRHNKSYFLSPVNQISQEEVKKIVEYIENNGINGSKKEIHDQIFFSILEININIETIKTLSSMVNIPIFRAHSLLS